MVLPKDDEPIQKVREEEFDDDYTLIIALTGTITHGSDTWLIDSGASRHMTENKEVIFVEIIKVLLHSLDKYFI